MITAELTHGPSGWTISEGSGEDIVTTIVWMPEGADSASAIATLLAAREPEDGPTDAELLAISRAGMIVSRLQGRLTLGSEVCAALDAIADDPETPWAMQEAIRNAMEWQRTSQTMDELGYLLGYTEEQMDLLFIAAEQVAV